MPPRYPFPWRLALALLRDAPLRRIRSFQIDSRACLQLLSPPPKIFCPENIPARGPALLLTNHYARPGFRAWWIAFAISASIPTEVHWMMTDTWTFLGPFSPLSHGVLTRLAGIYGFTTSPPMPPRPNDVEARARSVRQILEIARSSEAMIALAPEGRDQPAGILGPLPPGAGRFLEHLTRQRYPIIPIGVYEDDCSLCLSFGPPFLLKVTSQLPARERDLAVGHQVMRAIAQQLPPHLRGIYASQVTA